MFTAVRQLLEAGVAERIFPAAVVEVGTATQAVWSAAVGRLTYDIDAPETSLDTIFDLASLTKVLATTSLVMQQVEQGVLALDDRIAGTVPAWDGADRAEVTIRDLLAHCSGLPAHRRYFEQLRGRGAYEHAIGAEPLEYEPRTKAIYSDLGFMLLGFIIAPDGDLARRFASLLAQMNVVDPLGFGVPPQWSHRVAPTTVDPWRGRLLVGEVDDENAAALDGVAGHAGLFGTAAAVGASARHLLQILDGRRGALSMETIRAAITRREGIQSSSRGLGWDTMLPTSSCGSLMSPRAFGHTGFTGTSLWIDPDRAAYVVLLTNRVHPDRQDRGILGLRRRVHDAVINALGGESPPPTSN